MKKLILSISCLFLYSLCSSNSSPYTSIELAIKNNDYQAFTQALKDNVLTKQERLTLTHLNAQINKELSMQYTVYLRSNALSLFNPVKLAARILIGQPNRYTFLGILGITGAIFVANETNNIGLAALPGVLGAGLYIKGRIQSWKNSNELSNRLDNSTSIHNHLTSLTQ